MQHIIDYIDKLIDALPPAVGGFLMAMVVAALRVVYDREENNPTRIGLESLICGCLTVAGGSAAQAAGWGDGWHLFIGGLVGFFGTQGVRSFAMVVINSRFRK